MNALRTLCLVAAGLVGPVVMDAADASAFRPFTVEWPREAGSPASVAFLLDAPAGGDGFIRAKDGHFARPNGGRFRIWGINATAQATVTPKADAPALAAHLARVGINCVRFYFLDRIAPGGLVDASRDERRHRMAAPHRRTNCNLVGRNRCAMTTEEGT